MAAFVSPLTGCSGGTPTKKSVGIPSPKPDRVATFDLSTLSSTHDVNDATSDYMHGHVISDRSGNVYMLDASDTGLGILKMAPSGTVSGFSRIRDARWATGMAATPDGGILIGGSDGDTDQLYRVDRDGKATSVDTPEFHHPNPIGARPDGSMVVLDGKTLWSLKGTRKTRLHTLPQEPPNGSITVDATGTVYAEKGASLKDLLVLAPGHSPRTVSPRGSIPGTNSPVSSLSAITMSPASGGGLYAKAVRDTNKGPSGHAYVVHVRASGATTVLARGTMNKENLSCKSGRQYPSLNVPCAMPWFVVQSGQRVLVMGSVTGAGTHHIPAFALRTDTKKE
ncbi:hypothetical protein [Streptomyces natalensis]|uniref:hypothetical protein n=1 Tax=Streptomyces natalensis TaxID=68242 RepID=UPI0012FE8556|nr:hypothetical protein [Streptomyces natalensis]